MLKHFFLLMLLLMSFQQAAAHDAWLRQTGDGAMVLYGHGEKLDAYDPGKVKDARAVDCNGGNVPLQTNSREDGVLLTFQGTPAIVTVLFDGGYGVKTTDGWKKIGKREAQGKFSIVEALKSRKFSKAMLKPCEAVSKPIGLALEIVPEKDPFSVKPKETLPITVLLDGKPLEGATIKTAASKNPGQEALKSDKDGKASLVIGEPGFQIIVASYKTPLKNDPDADVLSLSSSLTFESK